MKIAIRAFLFTKWNVDVNSCHVAKIIQSRTSTLELK
jgi:hypothetical protein